jgi:two-component system response regulator RegA
MSSASILIVEDDRDVRRSAQIALAPHFERIVEAESASEIEGTLSTASFDAVLLDMNFVAGERSGAAGLDVLTRILTVDPTLAVVLMTAYGGVALAVESLKRGGVDFVLKPWRNDKLLAVIRNAVEITRTRRAAETLQLAALERDAIERALARHHGNISSAATALGLSRAALYRRMAKYGLLRL